MTMSNNPGMETAGGKEILMDADRARPCVDLLLNVIEGAAQPFVIADTNGRIVGCNTAFCRMLGYSRESLVAMKRIADLTPAEWRKNESGVIAAQVRSKMPAIYRKEYFHKDGSRLQIEVYNHTIFDKAGRPLYFYAFVTDLSGRK
jgi:PAS domain S-box-containing protein